jgi:FkbM family methyltransferase
MRFLIHPLARWARAARLSMLGDEPQWRMIGCGGLVMKIDRKDYSDRAYCVGLYERHILHLIRTIVRPGDVCIDVGAQKGYITLHLAKAVKSSGRVMAFEPDPRAMELLQAHCGRNRLENVALYPYALADAPGKCGFTLSKQLGWSSRFPNPLAAAVQASMIEVDTHRLDDVVAAPGVRPQSISFIKIDAEGSEPLVLAGAEQTLRTFRPILLFEVNKPSLRAANLSTEGMEERLRALGYQLYTILLMRVGFRLTLSLAPVESLACSIGEFDNILAVTSDAEHVRRMEAAAPGFRAMLLNTRTDGCQGQSPIVNSRHSRREGGKI